MTQEHTWAGLRQALTEYRTAEASKADLYRQEKLPHWEARNAYERKERASDNLAAATQAVLDARDAQADEIEARYSAPEGPPAVPHDWMGTWEIHAEGDGYAWTVSYRGTARIGFARSMTKARVAAKVALEIMWSSWTIKHNTTAPEPNYARTPSDSFFAP